MSKVQKTILSESELRSLKEEKNELENTLKELNSKTGDGTRGGSINQETIKRQAAQIDRAIHLGSPEKLKDAARDKLAKRAAELEEQFLRGMPNSDQMRRPAKYPGVVRQNLDWQRRNSSAIKEWKQLQRQLEPGDPTAPSVERLRKQA